MTLNRVLILSHLKLKSLKLLKVTFAIWLQSKHHFCKLKIIMMKMPSPIIFLRLCRH